MRKELEERLINFSASIIHLNEEKNNDYFTNHMFQQIIRSSTSAALNYGETQGAVSKKDFIHKASIVLKELRETNINLRIMQKVRINTNVPAIAKAIEESNELISIFHKTVQTAKRNM